MKKSFILLLGILMVVVPVAVFAQVQPISSSGINCMNVVGLQALICKTGEILNTAIPVIITIGVVLFIWGIVQYIIGGTEEAKKKGRDKIIYGLIGLVVIVGMWGLVRAVTQSFGIDNNPSGINPPCLPGSPGCN